MSWCSAARRGGIARVARTGRSALQIFRGVLLVAEICVTVLSFVLLGLIATHAIFSVYPLLVAALAGPVLGEYVGWRRGLAIVVGLVGVLVILRPGFQVFSPVALVPLLGGADVRALRAPDPARGAHATAPRRASSTPASPAPWRSPSSRRSGGRRSQGAADWLWMAALCAMGVLGHFLLIKVYEVAEAGTVQPFAYFQLVFVASSASPSSTSAPTPGPSPAAP